MRIFMPGIKVRDNENWESANRRFKRAVEKSGILSEIRRREYHETRSAKRQRALAAAIKRFRKKQMRENKGDFGGSVHGKRSTLRVSASVVRRNKEANNNNAQNEMKSSD